MKEERYTKLIHKDLSGDISPAEKEQLEAWLRESSNHQLIAKHIRQTWDWSANFHSDVDLDLDADFAQLQKKINPEAKQKPTIAKERKLPKRNNWWAIAAGFLVLILAGFALRPFFQTKATIEIANTSAGETLDLQLADGTRVHLNENSSLHYPTTFHSGERRVDLKGEAFFEVAKDPEKTFVVQSPNSEVRVLGTVFSVEDYKQNDFVSVVVQEGKVQLQGKGKSDHLILTAQEKGLYQKGKNILIKQENHHMNDQAWHTNKLVYQEAALVDVLKDIGELYKVEVQLKNKGMNNCKFTGTFDQQNIDTALKTISTVFVLSVEKLNATTFVLSGRESCDF